MIKATATPRNPHNKSEMSASLVECAYRLKLDEIVAGSLPMGAVVSRRSLAKKFGMSSVPATDALQRLERDGLLESHPHGYIVCRIGNHRGNRRT